VDISPCWRGGAPEREALFWHFPGYLGAGRDQ